MRGSKLITLCGQLTDEMISLEQENKDKVNVYLASLSTRAFRTAAEVLDSIRTYQVIFRVLLIFEFLQLLYFCTSPRLKMVYDLNIFTYISYMTSFFQVGSYSRNNGDQRIQDITLYIISSISLFSITIFLLLPLWLVTEKKPLSTAANVCIRIAAFYFMLFESVLIIPFVQISYYSMVCNNEIPYYQSKRMKV